MTFVAASSPPPAEDESERVADLVQLVETAVRGQLDEIGSNRKPRVTLILELRRLVNELDAEERSRWFTDYPVRRR